MTQRTGFRAVCIGGGCGAPQVMIGLRAYTDQITGIIAVTDSGRSTGKIRIAVNVPAPGDIRNALVALAEGDPVLRALFSHRFSTDKSPDLDGMAFGNLFIAALTQMTGSFEQAVAESARLLGLRGQVLPVTLYNTHLCAELEDGTILEQEYNVRALNKPPIKRVFLQHDDIVTSEACAEALRQADLITLGPGSLFTTDIACLLVRGIAEGIRSSRAVRVFIANTTTQPGQTDGLSLSRHVAEIRHYLGGDGIDYVLINNASPPPAVVQHYASQNVYLLEPTPAEIEAIRQMGVTPIVGPFADVDAGPRNLWQKQDSIRHDPRKVADALLSLL